MWQREVRELPDELEKLRAELKHWEMEGVLATLDKSMAKNMN